MGLRPCHKTVKVAMVVTMTPPPPQLCIHMQLFTTYGQYFIFWNMHAYILYLMHEHVNIYTNLDEDVSP